MLNTGESERDVKGSGEVAKREPSETPKGLQIVRGVIVVGGRESRLHGKGLQAEGCAGSTKVPIV